MPLKDLTPEILELIRRTSTDLPADIESRLREAQKNEALDSAARKAMDTILANVEMTRRDSTPICQDTGTPLFFVKIPEGWNARDIRDWIRAAVADATRLTYLRPNAVDSLNGKNSGNNLGSKYFPTIHFEEIDDGDLTIDLILKGGGCENVGAQYSLPDERLKAGRDLEGVRRVVLDAVNRAQGEGCAPGFLGVAIGGDRGTGYVASKETLIQPLETKNPDPGLEALENRITTEANQLGIGPMGFGGKATILGTKITAEHRLPASYFVTVSYMCWAYRRRRMIVRDDQTTYL
jgi:fumarate hydratase class I